MTTEETVKAIRASNVYLGEDGAVPGRSCQGTKLEGLAPERGIFLSFGKGEISGQDNGLSDPGSIRGD